jgi:hypothetical protein
MRVLCSFHEGPWDGALFAASVNQPPGEMVWGRHEIEVVHDWGIAIVPAAIITCPDQAVPNAVGPYLRQNVWSEPSRRYYAYLWAPGLLAELS